jgi:hypothetical protein
MDQAELMRTFVDLIRRQSWFAIAILVGTIILISAPVYSYRIMNPVDSDYGSHIAFAIDLIKRQPVPTYTLAHPIIQILLIGIYWISRARISLYLAAVIVQVVAQVLTALVLYFWFGPLPGRWGPAWRVFWAVSLTLVAPLMALVFTDGQYYYGYIGLANYHNPTVHLLRPFALVSFLLAVRLLTRPRTPAGVVVISAAVIVASALIKPSYALVILPALGLLVLIRWLRKEPVDWWMALGGFAIPACAVLAVQGIVTYSDGSSIIFAPLVVEGAYSGTLPLKFLLSIVFPLAVLLAYFRPLRQNPEMQLAWLAFGVGAMQLYLLAESGNRLPDANFRWSAQIGLFLLFAASARYLLRCTPVLTKTRLKSSLLVAGAYLPHLIAGAAYYFHMFASKGYG